jgi:hypothetical protein
MVNVARQVGTPDPQKRTSPICELGEEDNTAGPAGTEPGETTCFFNGEAFPQGTEVESGGSVLRCERGSWIAAPPPSEQQS